MLNNACMYARACPGMHGACWGVQGRAGACTGVLRRACMHGRAAFWGVHACTGVLGRTCMHGRAGACMHAWACWGVHACTGMLGRACMRGRARACMHAHGRTRAFAYSGVSSLANSTGVHACTGALEQCGGVHACTGVALRAQSDFTNGKRLLCYHTEGPSPQAPLQFLYSRVQWDRVSLAIISLFR